MRVHVIQHDWPEFPDSGGAHKLAWSYLLDYIFADTYHHQISALELSVPNPGVARAIEERATITADPPKTGYPAYAQLSFNRNVPQHAQRIYHLHFGSLAPASLRHNPRPRVLSGRKQIATLYVYTWQALILGVPMRLGNVLSCPYWADRCTLMMRQRFTTTQACPAYYRLETWI